MNLSPLPAISPGVSPGQSKSVKGVSFAPTFHSIALPPIKPDPRDPRDGPRDGGLSEDIDCTTWLREIDMEQYIPTFLTNLSIDGRIVLRRRMAGIRQQDLSAMNITDYDHQRYLMQHIRLVLKHPFHSQLHRKESQMIQSPLKKARSPLKPTNPGSGTLDLTGLVTQIDDEINRAHKQADIEEVSRRSSEHTKDAKALQKEKKKADRRRRSFDNSVWQSISSLRTKENKSAAAAAALREGQFSESPSHSESASKKSSGGGGRRRWSFSEEQANTTARDKANAYGNLALEYDMLQSNLKALENEYLSKFCSTLSCEKASIFFVNEDTHELVICTDANTWYRIPPGSGIAGFCAETGQSLNIADAYGDYRFNQNMDKRTGFKTRNILCQPVRRIRGGGTICAVIQMINKNNGEDFTSADEEVLSVCVQRIADMLSDKFKDLQQCAKKFSAGAIYVGSKGASAIRDSAAGYQQATAASRDRVITKSFEV